MSDGLLKANCVLVLGNLHAHAKARVHATFDAVEIERADVALLKPSDATKIVAIVGTGTIANALIDALPNLQIIANFGVGYDGIDAGYAASKNVMVTNTPDVLTEEVADTTVGLLLNTVREFSAAERYLREGHWSKANYRLTPLTLRGRSIGIFGMGRIGLAIARRLEAFGVSIAYHNRRPVMGVSYAYHETLLGLAGAVDTLIVVVPGGEGTRKAINGEVLAALGKTGVLINIGRGSTVDEEALLTALHDGTIAAAGLDVFENEPLIAPALLEAPNLVLFPHVGSASVETRTAMANLCVDNLVSWFSGRGAVTPVVETAQVLTGAKAL